MANPVDHAHGTQTSVIGTEHSLTTVTVAGTFVLEVDLSAMAAGDVVLVRWKAKTLTSGTERAGDVYMRAGKQPVDALQLVTDFIPNINTDASSVEYTLQHIIGSAASFPWQVYKYT